MRLARPFACERLPPPPRGNRTALISRAALPGDRIEPGDRTRDRRSTRAEPVRLLAGVRELDRHEPLDLGGEQQAPEVTPVRIDLSSHESIERSLDELGEELARIDVLVNNAGEFVGGPLDRVDVNSVYTTAQANLIGLMHLTRRVLPHMLERGEGKIVNQSSISGYAPFPGTAVYAATKAGVSAFTQALRRELEETGVTTLELITGGYDTDMLDRAAKELSDHTDPSSWEYRDPGDWADEIIDAIKSDRDRLEPGGKSELARLAAVGPPGILDALTKRAFER